jgi:hypothetical protein
VVFYSYLRLSEFLSDVTQSRKDVVVFCRVKRFSPPQDQKVSIKEMKFTACFNGVTRVFLKQAVIPIEDPKGAEIFTFKFDMEFKAICEFFRKQGCRLVSGEVGEELLNGDIDIKELNDAISGLVKVKLEDDAKKTPEVVSPQENPVDPPQNIVEFPKPTSETPAS